MSENATLLHPAFGRITPVEQGVGLVYDMGDFISTLEGGAVELTRDISLWQQQIPGKHLMIRHITDVSNETPLRDPLPITHDALVKHTRQYNNGEVKRLRTAGIRMLPCSQFVVEHDPGTIKRTAGVYTIVPKYGPGHTLEDANWDHLDVQRIGLHVAAKRSCGEYGRTSLE